MPIEKFNRDRTEFSRFQNEAKKVDIDLNLNRIVDKCNELIDYVNFLGLGVVDNFQSEENFNKFLYWDADGHLIAKELDVGDIQVASVSSLPDDFVTRDMISREAITSEKIAPGSIQNKHLSQGCIENKHIQVGAITSDLLAPDFLITGDKIANSTIPGTVFVDGSIPVSKLSTNVWNNINIVTPNKVDFFVVQNADERQISIPEISEYMRSFDSSVHFHFKFTGTMKTQNVGTFPSIVFVDEEQQEKFRTEQQPVFQYSFANNEFVFILELIARDIEIEETDQIIFEIPNAISSVNLYGEVIANDLIGEFA